MADIDISPGETGGESARSTWGKSENSALQWERARDPRPPAPASSTWSDLVGQELWDLESDRRERASKSRVERRVRAPLPALKSPPPIGSCGVTWRLPVYAKPLHRESGCDLLFKLAVALRFLRKSALSEALRAPISIGAFFYAVRATGAGAVFRICTTEFMYVITLARSLALPASASPWAITGSMS
jgi:hypothetical protein